MKYIELSRSGKYSLLMDEADTKFLVVYGYDPNEPENQQWSHTVTDYLYWEDKSKKPRYLSAAIDFLRRKTEPDYISVSRLMELATRFKDCIDGDEDMEWVIDDMEEHELKFFGLEWRQEDDV